MTQSAIRTSSRKSRGRHLAETPSASSHRITFMAAAATTVVASMPAAAMAAPTDLNEIDFSAPTTQAQAAVEVAPAFEVANTADWKFSGLPVQTTTVNVEKAAVPALAGQETAPVDTTVTQVAAVSVTTGQASRAARAGEAGGPAGAQGTANTRTTGNERGAAASAAPAAAPTAAYSGNISGLRAEILEIARRYQGTRYVSGGASPAGFDCSGFTSYVFAKAGVALPRTSGGQRGAGRVVSAAEARPGDLVWWPGHVGIYTGNGRHIAARMPGVPLKEGPVYNHPVYIRVINN